MLLAINYSPPAANLVDSGQIDIDYFKTPDWSWMIREAGRLRPVAVHFVLEVGNGQIKDINRDEIESILHTTGTQYINVHLDPKQKYFPKLSLDTVEKADIKHVYEIILSEVVMLVNVFGPERIIIENSPYRGVVGNTLRLCVCPDLITRIVEETGCGFLLDISHAIIASKYIGMDTFEYFNRLPTAKIKEMHFAGIHKIKGALVDHLSIKKKDWKWLEWVLLQIQSGEWSTPWLLAFEYGGVGREFEWRCDPEVILKQVPQLKERVSKFRDG